MKIQLSLLVAVLALAGCGGGGGSQAVPAAGGSTNAKTATSQGTVVLSIPTRSSSGVVRYPQFVSPNATSVTLTINAGTAQTFDVSPTSPLCTTVAGARNCTLNFFAPIGADTLTFTIYSGANATGTVLSTGTNSQTVVQGTPFNVTIAMNATVGSIVANLNVTGAQTCPNAAAFAGITEGCAGSAALTVTVMDPAGNTVTGSAPYATPVQISTNDASITASPAQITAPGQSSSLTYNGTAFGAGITTSITGTLTIGTQTITQAIPVQRQYLYVANSNVVPGNTPAGGGNIAVYTFGSGMGSTPVRVISGTNTLLYDPIAVLLDSNDNLYVLDNGRYVGGQSHPAILVFAPGANGNVFPARQISSLNNGAVVTAPYTCETMILNPAQTYLYVMCDDSGIGPGLIHVFPASGNGAAAGLQTAELGSDGWSTPLIGMAFDNSGNLYIADTRANSIGYYPPANIGSPTGGFQGTGGPASTINGGVAWAIAVSPSGLVVDKQGNLYASIVNIGAPGVNDVSNQIGMWKSTSIPCTNCFPDTSVSGAPITTHAPAGIALDAAGNLYVGNTTTNQVFVFARTTVVAGGNTIMNTITTNTGGAANNPVGMAIGP